VIENAVVAVAVAVGILVCIHQCQGELATGAILLDLLLDISLACHENHRGELYRF
jgi:hypothetical protein